MEFNEELIEELFNELNLNSEIRYEEIPSIDLYMDQVITLFENNLNNTKRKEEDKILTKTMINNYAKDKLLMKIKNKKYSREHIIVMILIYNLKQGLSIADIKSLLSLLVDKEENSNEIDIPGLYRKYLDIKSQDEVDNKKILMEKYYRAEEMIKASASNNKDYEKVLLTVLSLINTSNIQKRLAEKIIDNFINNN